MRSPRSRDHLVSSRSLSLACRCRTSNCVNENLNSCCLCLSILLFLILLFLFMRSHCIAQACFRLMLLPVPLQGWDYSCGPLRLTCNFLFT